ncbi:hypothetical protein ACO0RG_001630 [Hanseniaspora osmophila]|uniref:Uncharacterized protein n=1 Tax=Hanseniaspora osmophila TaxID=56408 RepID=A0A1E5RHQ8_9ASCO|nr:hypothetical protein AWRI3579_g1658 [Hanseniaspora osmophila]
MTIKNKYAKPSGSKKNNANTKGNIKKHNTPLSKNTKKRTKHQLQQLNKEDIDLASVHQEIKAGASTACSVLPQQKLTGKQLLELNKQDVATQKEKKEKDEKVANDLVKQLELIDGFQL